MLNPNISLAELLIVLDKKLPPEEWPRFDPATIMLELGETNELLIDKINVLQLCMYGVNEMLAKPEFVLWMTSVANNNPAEFETLEMPTSLELAWMIVQAKAVAILSKQVWAPKEELGMTIEYLLNEDGFSTAPAPFDFVKPKLLQPGQTEEDIKLKALGIRTYLEHMMKNSHA